MRRYPPEVLTPIEGKPDYTREAIIKTVWEGVKYPVCKLTYYHYWNEEFMYVFEPMYDEIEKVQKLSPYAFMGIPSIDLDLKLDKYIRRNITPAFIVSRTPPKNREDVREMMEAVGLDHYDAFEFLIRTTTRASQDNFIVEADN